MATHRHFNPHDPFPADWANALGEFLGSSSHNFSLIIKPTDATVLQVPAGTDTAKVAISVDGPWRWNTATVERASPGGAARTLDVHVTASANAFVAGDPEIDNTDYSFALAITEAGVAPVGVALSRKVATAVWNGARFTAVDVLVGAQAGTARHAATHQPGSSDPVTGLTDASFAAANKDGLVGLASLRTLGSNPQQAQPGDLHFGTVGRAYVTSAPLMAAGWRKLPIDQLRFDPIGHFDFLTNRYTVPVAGYYLVVGNLNAQINNNPQTFGVAIYKNGAVAAQSGETERGGTTGDEISAVVTDIIQCAAGDYLELWGFNSGPNVVQYNADPSVNYLSVCRVA